MKLSKYLAFLTIAARQVTDARALFLGRVALYGVLLVIYARIWHIVGDKGALGAFGHADLIWYLAITEWIVLSMPPLFSDIEADIRTGNIVYLLPRPISYIWMRFAEGLGNLLSRMAILSPFGIGFALALAGSWPSGGVLALICGALTAVVAATLNLIFYALIGLSAFFIEDTSPLFWIWQKLSFVFGGLMFPLDIYPDPLRRVASLTPFPALLYAPGRIAIGAGPAFTWHTTFVLAGWLLFSACAAELFFRRAVKSFELNGG